MTPGSAGDEGNPRQYQPRHAMLVTYESPVTQGGVDSGRDVYLTAVGGSDVITSPDGTRIAYLSRGRVFTRRLDQASATELAIGQGATSPFFSPDGQWIGFTANGKLRKVSVEGGSRLYCATQEPRTPAAIDATTAMSS